MAILIWYLFLFESIILLYLLFLLVNLALVDYIAYTYLFKFMYSYPMSSLAYVLP